MQLFFNILKFEESKLQSGLFRLLFEESKKDHNKKIANTLSEDSFQSPSLGHLEPESESDWRQLVNTCLK